MSDKNSQQDNKVLKVFIGFLGIILVFPVMFGMTVSYGDTGHMTSRVMDIIIGAGAILVFVSAIKVIFFDE